MLQVVFWSMASPVFGSFMPTTGIPRITRSSLRSFSSWISCTTARLSAAFTATAILVLGGYLGRYLARLYVQYSLKIRLSASSAFRAA